MEEKFKKFREEYIRTEHERLRLSFREFIMGQYVNLSPAEIAFHIDRKALVTSVLKEMAEEFTGGSNGKREI